MKRRDESWRKFECDVAEALRLSGYEVQQDVSLGAGQTDILATKTQSRLTTRLLVECKHSLRGRPVSINDVENFCGRVITLRSGDLVEGGLLVSNTPFTRQARALVTQRFIELLTFDDLLCGVLDFRPYLRDFCASFDRSHLSRNFVRPRLTDFIRDPGDHEEHRARSSVTDDSVIYDGRTFLRSWLEDYERSRICVLGDYGAGKTSLCMWLTTELGQEHLSNPIDCPVPLLIPLHRFTKQLDVRSLLTDFVANECGIGNFQYEALLYLINRGRVVLILDGFDEMARAVDREIRYQTIAELSTICTESAKLILTGRPSYFPTQDELLQVVAGADLHSDLYSAARSAVDELVTYDLVQLLPFTAEQVRDYVAQYFSDEDERTEMLRYIDTTYNLLDLASRPVLLDMMVKSLPRLTRRKSTAPSTIVNAANLYDVYTGLWVDREEKKGYFRRLIRKADKLRFMEELAFQMLLDARSSILPSNLGTPIREFFRVEDSQVEYFSHDIRTCSFLRRGPDGYTFVHRSFQEFFSARKLVAELRKPSPDAWAVRLMPFEVLRFSAELLASAPSDVSESLRALTRTRTSDFLEHNAVVVLLLAGATLPERIESDYGMPLDVLRAYAALWIGDSRGAQRFHEFLHRAILPALRAYSESESERGVSRFQAEDLAADAFYSLLPWFRSQPLQPLRWIVERARVFTRHDTFRTILEARRMEHLEIEFPDVSTSSSSPDVTYDRAEFWTEVQNALNPAEFEVIAKIYVEGFSVAELATAGGESEVALRQKVGRIRLKLSKVLKGLER